MAKSDTASDVCTAADLIDPPGLVFKYRELADELEHLSQSIGSKYLDPNAASRLKRASDRLRALSTDNSAGRVSRWEVTEEEAISTARSDGQHQRARQGHKRDDLSASISFIWEIVAWHHSPQSKKRSQPYDHFVLRNASVLIRFSRHTTGSRKVRRSAVWRFEIGDHASPGVHFHAQFCGHRQDVPRLPSILFSPADALEFVLGELFQDDWRRRASECSAQRWRTLQRQRLERLLQWHVDTIHAARGSPWMGLKVERPKPSLFI